MGASEQTEADETFIAPAYCDVIMKGGTASAIVYPPLLATLAVKFDLRNLAGTSAGSIGAGLGAAAEYRRQRSSPSATEDQQRAGYAILANFATRVAANGGIMALFEPTPATARAWQGLWNVLPALKQRRRLRALGGLVRAFRSVLAGSVVVGVLVGVTVALVPVGEVPADLIAPMRWLAVLVGGGAGLLTAGLLSTSCMVGDVRRLVEQTLPDQHYGLCPGAKLTQWLHGQLQDVAGLADDAPPLTFGDYEALTFGDGGHAQLRMVTSCLTHHRPYTLPFAQHTFFFDPEQLTPLVGDAVLAALVAGSTEAYQVPSGPVVHRLPDDLPVVFGMRLSMALPGVLSAVPLWTRHYSRIAEPADKTAASPEWVQVLFSDGGLTSNLPIHLFDNMVPRWPTVAVNLDYSPHEHEATPAWLCAGHTGGLQPPIFAIEGVLGFVTQMIETARNWQDSTQMTAPGQRDRIATVCLAGHEGGLNLDMPLATMTGVAKKAEAAGRLLVDRFGTAAGSGGLSWADHRWIRLLNSTKLLEECLERYQAAATASPGYQSLLTDPPSYRSCKGAAGQSVPSLQGASLSGALAACEHTPHPDCELKIRPKL